MSTRQRLAEFCESRRPWLDARREFASFISTCIADLTAARVEFDRLAAPELRAEAAEKIERAIGALHALRASPQNDEADGWVRDLMFVQQRLTEIVEGESSRETDAEIAGFADTMNANEVEIVVALFRAGAFHAAASRSSDEVCTLVGRDPMDAGALRRDWRRLCESGYVVSRSGRGNGAHLSDSGRALGEHLERSDQSKIAESARILRAV